METILSTANTTIMDDVAGAGARMGYPETGIEISPLTMDPTWNLNKRLTFACCFSAAAIILNGLYISAFFVAEPLRRTGYTFLCSLGLLDMIMGGVLPMISVVLMLSNEGDNVAVCHFDQALVTFCNYSYMLLYTFCAAENYYNIAWATRGYRFFSKKQVTTIVLSILTLSATLAVVGTYAKLDFDFCSREHDGNMEFRYITLIFLYAIPLVLSCFYLGYGIIRLRTRSRERLYKRSQKHRDQMSQLMTNTLIYIVYICCWTPFMTAIYRYPDTVTNKKLYYFSWIGISRCVFVPLFYCCCIPMFRNAYKESFCYCCCKGSIPARGQLNYRHRRAMEYRSPSGDVRVHLMQQKQHPGSPHRATVSSREGQEL